MSDEENGKQTAGLRQVRVVNRRQKAESRRQRALTNFRLERDDLAVSLDIDRRAVCGSNSVCVTRGSAQRVASLTGQFLRSVVRLFLHGPCSIGLGESPELS